MESKLTGTIELPIRDRCAGIPVGTNRHTGPSSVVEVAKQEPGPKPLVLTGEESRRTVAKARPSS
jgi:hypothetical protein